MLAHGPGNGEVLKHQDALEKRLARLDIAPALDLNERAVLVLPHLDSLRL